MARAFIIRPFGPKQDSAGKLIDFERVHRELIEPVLTAVGCGGGTTGQIVEAGNIREDMFALIIEADLVVCDITVHNANVFYELGIRHALRKKRTVLLKGEPTRDGTPFDVLTDRYLAYDIDNPSAAKDALIETLKATLASERETDSPIFKMLPGLAEVDPERVQAVPTDFTEEVGRARAARSAGWLRLLATEVLGQRFQWPGLRMVAQAQWDLKDYGGARKSWEKILEINPADIAANLALSNIYERLYRHEPDPILLERSNQAIARVLPSGALTRDQRAETLALAGRNRKTLWRRDFSGSNTVDERRTRATNRAGLEVYESYWKAFREDLNHYWSGLAALQMGNILLDLSQAPIWEDLFDVAAAAEQYQTKLKQQVDALTVTVRQSIEAALSRLQPNHPDRRWAEISRADLLFLTESRSQRVVRAYVDAIPPNDRFAWDAAKKQLELFVSLNIHGDLANQIIQTVDRRVEPPKEPDTNRHLILFAGHRVDDPDRREARFPADREEQARTLIRETLQALPNDGLHKEAWASAAPGGDILFHEVCDELGIPGTICLPMPKDDFAGLVFQQFDQWRGRFLKLVGAHPDRILVLSDREGLPKWLQGADLNPWKRGNHWVLEMARASGARKITLLALWDGKAVGDAPGGTAHMVRKARAAGMIDVVPIDAGKLLI